MYRRPRFLEILLEIREQMSRDADYDVDLFAEMVRSGRISRKQRDFHPDAEQSKNGSANGEPKED